MPIPRRDSSGRQPTRPVRARHNRHPVGPAARQARLLKMQRKLQMNAPRIRRDTPAIRPAPAGARATQLHALQQALDTLEIEPKVQFNAAPEPAPAPIVVPAPAPTPAPASEPVAVFHMPVHTPVPSVAPHHTPAPVIQQQHVPEVSEKTYVVGDTSESDDDEDSDAIMETTNTTTQTTQQITQQTTQATTPQIIQTADTKPAAATIAIREATTEATTETKPEITEPEITEPGIPPEVARNAELFALKCLWPTRFSLTDEDVAAAAAVRPAAFRFEIMQRAERHANAATDLACMFARTL